MQSAPDDSRAPDEAAGRPAKESREARLAAALRENLKRRKRQGRARREDNAGEPGRGANATVDDQGDR